MIKDKSKESFKVNQVISHLKDFCKVKTEKAMFALTTETTMNIMRTVLIELEWFVMIVE